MNVIFKKLNYKNQETIFVINPPDSFQSAMREMEPLAQVKTSRGNAKTIDFVLVFVTKQNEVDNAARVLAPCLSKDGILWFAYPKGTSKNYSCDFNRDSGWKSLGALGFEGVRMVAIDEDWTALRFKRAQDIKIMTRSFAMSEEGKRKVEKSRTKKG